MDHCSRCLIILAYTNKKSTKATVMVLSNAIINSSEALAVADGIETITGYYHAMDVTNNKIFKTKGKISYFFYALKLHPSQRKSKN